MSTSSDIRLGLEASAFAVGLSGGISVSSLASIYHTPSSFLLPKSCVAQFFFSQPGLANQAPVRDSRASAPLSQPRLCTISCLPR